jgi:glycerol uptake facilitator-like aquaporin
MNSRALTAEAIGTAFLLIAVVGSGIMAERLAGGNMAIALLANAIATGCALTVLILVFAPISGAHFNPAVSLYFALRRELPWKNAIAYAAIQIIAAMIGVALAHAMFGLPAFEASQKLRDGAPLFLAEFIATFGLLLTIIGARAYDKTVTAYAVALYITGAYWFTASTSFANPAVTLARSLTNTFAGIAPQSAPGFILAQIAATLAAAFVLPWLFEKKA